MIILLSKIKIKIFSVKIKEMKLSAYHMKQWENHLINNFHF